MRLRARLALSVFDWTRFLETLLPALLPPACLVELNRGHFSGNADFWSGQAQAGLFEEEALVLERSGVKAGRALCLASGGGREAFALERRGFEVLGVELVPELVRFAREHAAAHGLKARFVEGSLTELAVDGGRFDLISMANVAYSYIPTRRARVALLRRCRELLSPEGRVILSVVVRPAEASELRWAGRLRLLGRLAGNPLVEPGDRLVGNGNFIHFFPELGVVSQEAREAGFARVEEHVTESRSYLAVLAR